MQIKTTRFGNIEVEEDKIIYFANGLPGLDDFKKFVLLHIKETEPIVWLQSVKDADLSLPVVDPFIIQENYALEVGDREVAEIKISSPEEVHVLNVVVIPGGNLEKMTANLAAPILINVKKGLGKQIIIDGQGYDMRKPIFKAIIKHLQEVEDNASTNQTGR